MKVTVIANYPSEWEVIQFPTFPRGTAVSMVAEEDADFAHWHAAQIEGRETFVPVSFVTDGRLNRDYNPTELSQKAGDILEVREIVNAWLIATNERGETGWITAESVVSVNE